MSDPLAAIVAISIIVTIFIGIGCVVYGYSNWVTMRLASLAQRAPAAAAV